MPQPHDQRYLAISSRDLPDRQLNQPYPIQSFVSFPRPCVPSMAPAEALNKLVWIHNLQGLLVLQHQQSSCMQLGY